MSEDGKVVKLVPPVSNLEPNIGVAELLDNLSGRIKAGESTVNKAIVILASDDGGHTVQYGWSQSNMALTQCLAALEVVKYQILQAMEVR